MKLFPFVSLVKCSAAVAPCGCTFAVLGFSGACFGIFPRLPLFFASCQYWVILQQFFILPQFVFFPSLLHFFVLCFVVCQIEMAIETLQKSEGLSSQRSSLLNSHVSCFYKCLTVQYLNSCSAHSLLPFCLFQLSVHFSLVWCLLFWCLF